MASTPNPASAGSPAGAELLAQPKQFRAWYDGFAQHWNDADESWWNERPASEIDAWSIARQLLTGVEAEMADPTDEALHEFLYRKGLRLTDAEIHARLDVAPYVSPPETETEEPPKHAPRSADKRRPLKTGDDARAELRKLFAIGLTWPNIGERRLRVYKLGLRYAASLGVMEFVATPGGIGRALGQLDGGLAVPRSTIQHDLAWLARAGLLRKTEPGEQISNISKKILREWSRPGSRPNVWKLPRATDLTTTIPTDLV
jgi:hypothetical protein